MKLIGLAMVALMGCHATTTGNGNKEPQTGEPHAKPHEQAKVRAPPTTEAAKKAEPVPAEVQAREISVEASPQGVLQKGGAQKIQEALATHGFAVKVTDALDGPTQEALRKFQTQQKLAATGMPDQLTLKQLGLDPKSVLDTAPEAKKP